MNLILAQLTITQGTFPRSLEPRYTVPFSLAKNSVAFWDNRAVPRFTAANYWPNTRQMERVTIKGDRLY
jgi:taurine dioxygenase